MAQMIKTVGIVLNATPVGDYDKRLVLLTKEKGKIIAFAKGARRPNSPFLAGSQVFAFGEFVVYFGKSYNSIGQVTLSNTFHQLRQDIETLSYGLYFNEVVDVLTEENMLSTDYLLLTYITLETLTKMKLPLNLIRAIFELKIMSLSGYAPEVTQCLHQRCENNAHYFSPSVGGILCKEHSKLVNDLMQISEGTRYTMQYILASPLQKLYSFKVSDSILQELIYLLKRYMKYHMNYAFKSLEFIQKL